MYQKLNTILNFLFLVILFYLAYKYVQVKDYNILPVQKVKLLNKAADDFIDVGFIVCMASWVNTNLLAAKIKQLCWLFIPFLFIVFVSWIMSWQAEDIFIFNKLNGMWKAGFSMSYFLGIAIIIIAALILVINYFILKRTLKL